MDEVKRKLVELIEDLTEAELTEVLDFVGYLRLRRAKSESEYLDKVIETSEEFWGEDRG